MADGARRVIMTNNPLVARRLSRQYEVDYVPQSYLLLLERIRDMARQGAQILAHPLADSLRPGIVPYCSLLVTMPDSATQPDENSVRLIESAIGMTRTVPPQTDLAVLASLGELQQRDLLLLEKTLLAG